MLNTRLLTAMLLGIMALSCNNSSTPNSTNTNNKTSVKESLLENEITLEFQNKKYDFGDVNGKHNEYISTTFEFINNNESPIIIEKADVACGCVSTKFSAKPILKGEKGFVEVTLDTKQLSGVFDKKIFVKSNATNKVELLRVMGTVK